jgi:hypothetical protein
MKKIVMGSAALLALAGAPAVAELQVFPLPEYEGHRVDLCRVWGSECGQAAADEFCRRHGFTSADGFTVDHDIGAATPTRTLVDGGICNQAFCDGFESITCKRPGAGALSGTTSPGQPRPGRLKMPGMHGSPPAQPPQQELPPPPSSKGQSVDPSSGDDPHYPPGVLPDEPPPADPGKPHSSVPPAPPAQPPANPPAPEPVFVDPPWTAKDVMNPNIDVQAQYALFRMFKSAAPEHRRAASNMLSAVRARALKGIYQEDQQVPALRAQKLGMWWGQLLPKDFGSRCITEPAGDPPIIVMRRGVPADKANYDLELAVAWHLCEFESNWQGRWPLHRYDPTSAGDPPGTGVMQHCHGASQMAAALQVCQDLHQKSVKACKLHWLTVAAGNQSLADQLETNGGQPSCEDRLAARYATCQQDTYAACK